MTRRQPTTTHSSPLTQRQLQLLNFISEYTATKGFPPSMRGMGEYMKIASTNGINDHLKALERKGCITRELAMSRSTVLTARGNGLTTVTYDLTRVSTAALQFELRRRGEA